MNFTRPVIAFALLRQCSDTFQGDLLAGVSLLIKPVVADLAGQIYDSALLASRMEKAYGIPLTGTALEGFVPRLIAAGILHVELKQNGGPSKAIYCEQEQVVVPPEQEEEFQELIDDFLKHARNGLSKSSLSPSDNELIAGFLSHLSTLDFSSVRTRPIVVKNEVDKEGTIVGREQKERIDLSQNLAQGAAIDVLVASYISKLHSLNPDRLDLLSKVADGALGIELVLDLQAPYAVARLSNTTAVIDTPLLLQHLDLSSVAEWKAARTLISQLQQAGATIAAFQHTIEEAEGVLSAIQSARHTGVPYGPTVGRIANSVYRAYFESMINRISSTWVNKEHFELIQKAANHFYKNFSNEDEQALTHELMLSLEDRVLTREKDAKSVAEIIRRLGGAHIPADQIANCPYIFVTNNNSVRRRAARFLVDRGFIGPEDFIPIVTDRYMAGLCWLITGGKSENSPSTAQLLANCANALRLRPELAARTKNFLHKLDTEKALHFEALMTNDRASQYLMEATFGNPELITEQNVEEIYEEVQRRAVEKVAKEKDDLYLGKLGKLESEVVTNKEAMETLKQTLVEVEFDRERKERDLAEVSQRAEVFEGKFTSQSQEVANQAIKIEELDSEFKRVKDLAIDMEKRVTLQIEALQKNARRYAEKIIFRIRAAGGLLAVGFTVLLGYADKFWVQQLSLDHQYWGNWAVILVQALLVLLGIAVFFEKFTDWFIVSLRENLYKKRLSELGALTETQGPDNES